jgi:RluA family pseudouridine synthase
MPPKKIQLKTTHEHQRQRLDHVLSLLLPEAIGQPLSKAKIRMLVVAGAVYLNGRRVRIASKEILANAKIDVYIDFQKLGASGLSQDRVFKMCDRDILYEDEYVIAVNKPPGLPTQPTLDEARDNLFAAVKKFLASRDKTASPYLALHHRLDRDTSGVLILVKDVRANAGVADAFSKHRAQKTYLAIAEGRPPAHEWVTQNYLARDKSVSGKASRFMAVQSGGDFAQTAFQVREELGNCALIQAMPKTGRTHQIRVHLSEAGLPIVGDATYGGNKSIAPRLMLHAARLTLPHPITQTLLSIDCPLPKDFEECLRKLR